MTAQLLALRKNSALLCVIDKMEPVLPQPDYSRLALANRHLVREENAEQMRRRRERDAAFALAAGVPVAWAVRNLRSWS